MPRNSKARRKPSRVSLSDFSPAPYNPREISAEAQKGQGMKRTQTAFDLAEAWSMLRRRGNDRNQLFMKMLDAGVRCTRLEKLAVHDHNAADRLERRLRAIPAGGGRARESS